MNDKMLVIRTMKYTDDDDANRLGITQSNRSFYRK
jgi:hypothetical protein